MPRREGQGTGKESPGVAFARARELQKRQMPLRHEVESTGMDLTRPTLSGRAGGVFDLYQFDADFSRAWSAWLRRWRVASQSTQAKTALKAAKVPMIPARNKMSTNGMPSLLCANHREGTAGGVARPRLTGFDLNQNRRDRCPHLQLPGGALRAARMRTITSPKIVGRMPQPRAP